MVRSFGCGPKEQDSISCIRPIILSSRRLKVGKDNNYEIYRKIRTQEEFFLTWEPQSLEVLNESLKDRIYKKYLVKCSVFQRDGFKCKNEGCMTPDSPLTMHHIKFQKNNGKDTIKNCVIICKTCHKGFHRGKNILTFDGAVYQLHREEKIDWKVIRAANKLKRKENKEFCGINISWELFAVLMRFLETDYGSYDDLEDDV